MKVPGESGQATTLMALFMGLVMLGFMALAIDVGYLYRAKRMAQSAADAAAIAAAEELTNVSGSSITTSNVVNAANVAATLNGFDTTLATNPASVSLAQSGSGHYSVADVPVPTTWVTATVSQPIQSFFMGVFNHGMKTLTVSASAQAAGGAASPACICLTGTAGNDLNMSNNAKLNANQCGVEADSVSNNAITIVGSASVCGTSVEAVSTNWNNSSNINNSGTICSSANAVQGAAPCSSSLVPPTMPAGLVGHCTDNPIQYGVGLAANSLSSSNYNTDYTLPFNGAQKMVNGQAVAMPNDTVVSGSVCYTNFNLAPAAEVVFSPGTYYINGDFITGGGEKIIGTGVTFIVSGTINIANGVTVNLSAPTTDGAPGVLFYDTSANTVTIQGGSNSNFAGIISAPNASLILNNGTGTTTNMDIVAKTLTMAGGAALNSYATPLMGGGAATGVARLVQ